VLSRAFVLIHAIYPLGNINLIDSSKCVPIAEEAIGSGQIATREKLPKEPPLLLNYD